MKFPYYKKPFKLKLIDSFTKTFDQIYVQYSKPEKAAYWLAVIVGFSIIAYKWIVRLKIF
jgi:hypothetical protein